MLSLLLTVLLQAEAPVKLWWDPPISMIGISGYVLRWGEVSGDYRYSMVTDVTGYSAEVMVGTGKTWYFVIQSFDSQGRRSAYSNEVRVDIPAPETPPKPGRRKRPNG